VLIIQSKNRELTIKMSPYNIDILLVNQVIKRKICSVIKMQKKLIDRVLTMVETLENEEKTDRMLMNSLKEIL
jgi:hypothetical protein